MQININIRCDNAAFEPRNGVEIARILRKLADEIEPLDLLSEELDSYVLMDINGNSVGSVKMVK